MVPVVDIFRQPELLFYGMPSAVLRACFLFLIRRFAVVHHYIAIFVTVNQEADTR